MKLPIGLSALLLLVSCGPDKQAASSASVFDDPGVVATVGGDRIMAAEIEAAVAEHGGSPEAVLDQLIEHRALVQEARESGIEQDPGFIAAVERLMINRMKEKREAAPAAEIADADIEARYRAQLQKWTIPARARFAMIFMETPARCSDEKRAELLARLEGVREAVLGAPDKFATLAAEHSSDQATRYRGGDIGFVTQGVGAEEVDEAALAAGFSLNASGELTSVVTTPRGHWLLRLTERTPAAVRPLADVREAIRADLRRERAAAADAQIRESLLAGRKVERRTGRLPAARAEAARNTVPPAPPGQSSPARSM